MLEVLETIGEVSHVPMNPVFVPSITYKSIELAKQFTLYFIKALSNGLARDMKFLSNGMGRKTKRLLGRIVRNCNRSDAWRECVVVIV